MTIRALQIPLVLFLGFSMLGCVQTFGTLVEDVEFDGKDGSDLFQFEGDDRGFELEDPDGNKLMEFRYVDDALRIENRAGKKIGFVLMEGDHLIVVDRNSQELYRLSIEPDGDVRVESNDQVIYKLKTRESGYKIVDGSGAETGRVKADEKISIKDPNGQTYLKTKDKIQPLAAACMGLNALELEYRAALLVGVVAFKFGG